MLKITYLNPKWIVVDFLRQQIDDPRGRATSTSDTFAATSLQTVFQLTPTSGKKLSSITSVTVEAATKNKWFDYWIDFKLQQIVFFSGITLDDEVIVTYDEADEDEDWIYWAKPVTKLQDTAFPRILVQVVTGNGQRLGEQNAPVESLIHFQVDVWCKEKAANQIFTIDGRAYTGNDLAEYFAYQVQGAFEDNIVDLNPVMYNYRPLQMPPRDMPFDVEYQAHHKITEFSLKGITIGRV